MSQIMADMNSNGEGEKKKEEEEGVAEIRSSSVWEVLLYTNPHLHLHH